MQQPSPVGSVENDVPVGLYVCFFLEILRLMLHYDVILLVNVD